MYKVRYKRFEIPEKEARKHVIVFALWFFLTIGSFFASMFVTYKLLVVFLLLLLCALPMTLIISGRSKKMQREVIKEFDLEVRNHEIYHGKILWHVYYDKKKEEVILYHVVNTGRYQIKNDAFAVLKEEQEDFLEFCRFHKVDTKSKAYMI